MNVEQRTKEYNHKHSQKLIEKIKYENELEDEIKEFDLLEYLYNSKQESR